MEEQADVEIALDVDPNDSKPGEIEERGPKMEKRGKERRFVVGRPLFGGYRAESPPIEALSESIDRIMSLAL